MCSRTYNYMDKQNLFLKLLEAQLITYHKGDKSYSFLNFDRIKNYDDLNSLFFQVLAYKYDERNEDVKKSFEKSGIF